MIVNIVQQTFWQKATFNSTILMDQRPQRKKIQYEIKMAT